MVRYFEIAQFISSSILIVFSLITPHTEDLINIFTVINLVMFLSVSLSIYLSYTYETLRIVQLPSIAGFMIYNICQGFSGYAGGVAKFGTWLYLALQVWSVMLYDRFGFVNLDVADKFMNGLFGVGC